MAAEPQVNADPNVVVVMKTREMDWESTDAPGVSRKVLERVHDAEKGRETLLLRLDPGASYSTPETNQRVDIFVIEGSCSDGHGDYGKRSFIRNPAGATVTLTSKDGCELYLKRRNAFRDDEERIVIDTETCDWKAFPHRGADVVHFYRDKHGIDTSRYGMVYPEKRIPSHDHSMGEETLIVDGVLKDEHGVYDSGTWLRFPIGVAHAPYTEDGSCYMLIREGDLVW